MLTGKSPSTTCLPAGRNDHWFGSRTEPSARGPGQSAGAGRARGDGSETQAASPRSARKDDCWIRNFIRLVPAFYANLPGAGKAATAVERPRVVQEWADVFVIRHSVSSLLCCPHPFSPNIDHEPPDRSADLRSGANLVTFPNAPGPEAGAPPLRFM